MLTISGQPLLNLLTILWIDGPLLLGKDRESKAERQPCEGK